MRKTWAGMLLAGAALWSAGCDLFAGGLNGLGSNVNAGDNANGNGSFENDNGAPGNDNAADNANGNGDGDNANGDNANGNGDDPNDGGDDSGRSKPVPIVSRFDTGNEGWRLDGGAFPEPTRPTWNEDEQFVGVVDARFGYWRAPKQFLGNVSDAYGLALQFDTAWDNACCTNAARVILSGAGITLSHWPDYSPVASWSSFHVRLDETEEWLTPEGARATRSQVRAVLKSLSQLHILTGDTDGSQLDNVVLGASAGDPVEQDVISAFDDGDEGWRLDGGAFNTVTRAVFDDENGYVAIGDARFAYWVAPEKFRGNFSEFFGGSLRFDTSYDNNCCTSNAMVVLYGGGFAIGWRPDAFPGGTLTGFAVQLDESEAWFTADSQKATGSILRAVLKDLQVVRILTGDSGMTRLDNVEMVRP